MKKILMISLLLVGFNVQASVEQDLQNICTIVKEDDKISLRKKMRDIRKDYGLSLKDYYGGVYCSGKNLLLWADDNGSVGTASLMIKKLPKLQVKGLEGTFDNSSFNTMVKERIN